MRERMLFLSAQNQSAEDLEGEMRTGSILEILLGKFDIDLLTYASTLKDISTNDGTALKVHYINGCITSWRSMLRPLHILQNFTNRSHAEKDMKSTIMELCRSNNYRHVFISHSLLGNCIDMVRNLLPEASVITDTYRFESGLAVGKEIGKPSSSNPYYKLNEALVRRNKRRLMNKTGVLLATSEWDALSFKSLSFADARKVHVVPHFIKMNEYDTFTEPVAKENSMVLHWNMNTRQGIKAAQSFFKKSYPLIKEQVPDIKCYITSPEVHTDVLMLIKDDVSVIITGPLKPSADYIRRAKAVLVPILEGCEVSRNILESWALKTPVVTSSTVCERLNCEHNRNILLANTSVDVVASVITLLKNPEIATIIADRAHRTLLKDYEVNYVKNKILSLV
ncbi:glycosyltransferase [Paenibacillus sp. FSL K6-2859]|uniref:glycosyltransferase n=1 Tax=Paenibacillus sp. FSL K6-2859 TaxID=2921482 RepID=UPI0030F6CF0A